MAVAHNVSSYPAAEMEVLLVSGISDAEETHIPFSVVVTNSVTPCDPKTYSTYVLERGILLGGLRRLQDCDKDFMFTYTEDPNYGPFLQSVNGLAGNPEKHTYWELLGKKPNGQIIRLDVGIGCYIPSANEEIILNYTKY